MRASWPEVREVNLTLLKEADYLINVSHEFRVRLKKMVEMREKVRVRSACSVCPIYMFVVECFLNCMFKDLSSESDTVFIHY